jgi:YqaJ-like viral recombinase domain
VRDILYEREKPLSASMSSVAYGIENEPVAIRKYEEAKQISVKQCGLFMQPQWPYLGASPDGLVGDDGLVEVKCIPKVGTLHPRAAAAFPKFKLSVELKHGKLVMIHGSNHYIQIQAQCNIADKSYCDLILFCDGGYEVCVMQKKNLIT